MKIKIRLLALIAVVAMCLGVLCACQFLLPDDTGNSGTGDNNDNYVMKIEKTSSDGSADVYTVTYRDGTTSTLRVENGKDGKDGESLSAEDVFQKFLENHPGATYDDFLKAVVDLDAHQTTTVINKSLLSSMKVYTEFVEKKQVATWGGIRYTYEKAIYAGSAIIYKMTEEYTYLVTNYHVVYDVNANDSKIAEKITCYLYGSEGGYSDSGKTDELGCKVYDYGPYAIDCTFVGGAIGADLAVLKVKTADVLGINPQAQPVTLATDYHVGQTAIAIGNPEDEGISVTQGIISIDNEYIVLAIDNVQRTYRSIRIDTPLYSGNSGGGLFDESGKLVDITNAGDKADQNVNYAIPVDIVRQVVENVLYYQNGKVQKPMLGITVKSANSRYVFDEKTGFGKIVEDVVIESVSAASIADATLGLKAADKIVAVVINGTEYAISRYFEIGDWMYSVRVGDTVAVKYVRDGATATSAAYTITTADLIVVE